MKKFYFTFGTDSQFPYGINDYVLVEAEDLDQACSLFDAVHPPRHPGVCNCAFFYSEESFDKFRDQYYKDVSPVERIAVTRRKNA